MNTTYTRKIVNFGIAVFFFISLYPNSYGQGCQVNIYLSDTVLSPGWFGPNYCGAPTWSTSCVGNFVKSASWSQNLSFDGSEKGYRIFGGAVSYFLIEYLENNCNAEFAVENSVAKFIGLSITPDGKKRKLYAVLDNRGFYNLMVSLTKGVNIYREEL